MKLSAQNFTFIIRKFLKNNIPHTSKYAFKTQDSPTPLLPPVSFQPNWDNYSSHNPDLFSVTEGPKTNNKGLVYIISPTQRSGTNFLNNVLKLHTDLYIPEGENLPNEHFLYSYSHHLQTYVAETVAMWGKWLKDGEDAMDAHAKGLMHYLGRGLLQYFYESVPNEKILLLKTPDAGNLNNFFHLFPHGKLIILVRDGRDTVDSFVKSWGGETIFKKMCERWAQRADQIMNVIEHAKQSNKSNSYYIVRYDKLNNDTSNEVKAILKFLNLKPENYHWNELEKIPVLGSSSFIGNQLGVHWNPMEKGEEFIPTQKWKHWSEAKKKIFKKYAGKNLIKMGFVTDNNW